MSIKIDDHGTMYIHQGDTGSIILEGLSPDKDYSIYFAVKDKNRNTIGTELSVNSNYMTHVKFVLPGEFTDLLTVPQDEEYAIYYYAMKLCDENEENTLEFENSDFGTMNSIIVYPKMVEGI